MRSNRPDSPCINVCAMDPVTGLCAGCFRTIEEIANWLSYSEVQRAEVYCKLSDRQYACKAIDSCNRSTMAERDVVLNARCEECNSDFKCGSLNSARRCWCELLPGIAPPNLDSKQCLCPTCLLRAIEQIPQEGAESATVRNKAKNLCVPNATPEIVKRIQSEREILRFHLQWWSDVESELGQTDAVPLDKKD